MLRRILVHGGWLLNKVTVTVFGEGAKSPPSLVVDADGADQAIEMAPWKQGQLLRVEKVRAVANGDGSWSLFPEFSPVEQVAARLDESALDMSDLVPIDQTLIDNLNRACKEADQDPYRQTR